MPRIPHASDCSAARPRRTIACAAVLAALAGAASSSHARAIEPPAPSAPAAALESAVQTHAGPATFRILTPDAAASAASRDDRALIRADGSSLGWTSGYILTSRIVVRAADLASVEAATAGRNVKAVPAIDDGRPGPLREFFYIDCATVREAVRLAADLAAQAGKGAISEAYLDIDSPKSLRTNIPTDPGVPQQWHLMNPSNPAADVNADVAWKAGFTGAGVTVGVLEGGWDITHDDLIASYDAAASQSPAGQLDHGTATAGIVAAAANNGLGGVGVAFGGKVSRLYYGASTAIATAFGFRNDLNKIKTNSWGPPDSGFIANISSIELAAIADAALNGRGGLGTVIVWAGGNGGQNSDRVDYDPYGSNRYSMAIGSVDCMDRRAIYSEAGSSLMLVASSSFDLGFPPVCGVYTTWGFDTYTTQFGGTSAAAPVAAGVAALVLQANPMLTWRDVQHVLIRSARKLNPVDPTWVFNGAGAGNLRAWSEIYGFGALDAGAAVALAQSWTNRPAQSTYTGPATVLNQPIPDADPVGLSSAALVHSPLLVERVQVVLNAPHTRIGQLRITLTSPGGTTVTLAGIRFDNTAGGYSNFTFSPAAFWDERAAGNWTLKVADEVASPAATGTLGSWQILIHGHEPACRCDWNLSGDTSIQDLFDYLASYFTGRGDFGGDGVATVQDLFDFLGCWFGGC